MTVTMAVRWERAGVRGRATQVGSRGTRAVFAVALSLLATSSGLASTLHPRPALAAILGTFDRFPVVALGMSHGQQEEADLVLALIRSPGLADKTRNIVIEDGNALYQDRLDRYVAGADVPLDSLELVWRNTTQPGRGDAPLPRALIDAVREANRALPSGRRIRVLAGDPPIDWGRVHAPEDITPFFDARDTHFASIVADQVLARGQRALLVIGAGHVLRHGMSFEGVAAEPAPTVTQLIETRYPHSVYVISPHEDFGDRTRELEDRLATWPRPALCDLHAGWVGELDASLVYTGKVLRVGMDPRHPAAAYPGLKLRDLADGFLYLGPAASIHRVQWTRVADPPYAAEVARRDSLMMALDHALAPRASVQPLPVRR